jgi:ABC-type sugar transport system permease subunit
MQITKLNRSQVRFAYIALLPILALYLLLRIYPILHGFYLSLTNYQIGRSRYQFIGPQNYLSLWSDQNFIISLANTLLFAALTLIFSLLFALVFALIMDRRRIAGTALLQSLFFLPVVVSVVPSAIIWKWIYEPQFGILNYALSFFGVSPIGWLVNKNISLYSIVIFVVWRWIGYYLIIFWVGLKAIPDTYIEAATIDGAGRWRLVRSIIFPLLRPIILLATVLATVNGFIIFSEVYVMTVGSQAAPGNVVSVLTYDIYQRGLVFFRIGQANAEALYLFIILLGFTLTQFALNRRTELY